MQHNQLPFTSLRVRKIPLVDMGLPLQGNTPNRFIVTDQVTVVSIGAE